MMKKKKFSFFLTFFPFLSNSQWRLFVGSAKAACVVSGLGSLPMSHFCLYLILFYGQKMALKHSYVMSTRRKMLVVNYVIVLY